VKNDSFDGTNCSGAVKSTEDMNRHCNVRFISERLSLHNFSLMAERITCIDHSNPKFNEEVEAIELGRASQPSLQEISLFLNTPLEFGRFLGSELTTIYLAHGGQVIGIHHENETAWAIEGMELSLRHSNGRITTRFNVLLQHNNLKWLIGAFEDQQTPHYLMHARHRRAPFD